MKNKCIIILTSLTVFFSGITHPSSKMYPESFLTKNEIKLVKKGEILTSVFLKNKGDVYTSGVEKTSPVSNSYLTVSSFEFDMVAIEKGFFSMDRNINNRLKIYRASTDFPGLTGMIYYSKSEQTFATLILYSYRIQSSDDYIKKDTAGGGIPEHTVSHFAVKDNRMGLLTFRSEVISGGDDFIIINTSMGTVSKFGMKIFYPGDYRIYKFFIYDRTLKGYFFYTVQFMKVRSSILNKIDLIKPESFGNRIRAEDIHFLKSIGVDRPGSLAAFK